MITRVDDKLLDEARRFRLAWSCERCATFEPTSRVCALGYPNDMHRERPLVAGADLVFCKEFELT
ncbi:MAG: hypothetical protein U0271_42565 [Polyangiaceae bacterium]